MNNNDVNNFETVNKVDNMNTLDNLNNISDVNNVNVGPIVGVKKEISRKSFLLIIIFGVVAAGIIGYIVFGKLIFNKEGNNHSSGASLVVDNNQTEEKDEKQDIEEKFDDIEEDIGDSEPIDLDDSFDDNDSINQDAEESQDEVVNSNTENVQGSSSTQSEVFSTNDDSFDDLVKLLKNDYKSRGVDFYDENNIASWNINSIRYFGYHKDKENVKIYIASGSFSCKDGGISCIYMEQVDDTNVENFKAVFAASKNNGVYKLEYMDSLASEYYLKQNSNFIVVDTLVSK